MGRCWPAGFLAGKQLQKPLGDDHVAVGRDDVDVVRLHPPLVVDLRDRHRGRPGKDLGQLAGVRGGEVLHQDESHSGVDGQRAEHLCEGLEPARRGTDADDGKCRGLRRAFRDRRGSRPGLRGAGRGRRAYGSGWRRAGAPFFISHRASAYTRVSPAACLSLNQTLRAFQKRLASMAAIRRARTAFCASYSAWRFCRCWASSLFVHALLPGDLVLEDDGVHLSRKQAGLGDRRRVQDQKLFGTSTP